MLLLLAFRPADAESARGFIAALGLPVTLLAAFEGALPEVGATRTLRISDGDAAPADTIAQTIIQTAEGATHIAAASSARSKDVLARLAGLLDAPMLSEATALIALDTFERPTNAGALIETVQVTGSPIVITFRPANFPGGAASPNAAEETVAVGESEVKVSDRQRRATARPDLGGAKRVISGGRPMKDAETFERVIGGFADAMGGAVGATRAAVDSGIAANELQVGQTGKIVAPDLYIAAGVSGSTQHMAGIKDSKLIVAINKDPDAPIFEMADLGLVGDLYVILPELQAKIAARGNP